jgi:hypothetical protein
MRRKNSRLSPSENVLSNFAQEGYQTWAIN